MPLIGSPSTGAWPGLKAKGLRKLIKAMKREQLKPAAPFYAWPLSL